MFIRLSFRNIIAYFFLLLLLCGHTTDNIGAETQWLGKMGTGRTQALKEAGENIAGIFEDKRKRDLELIEKALAIAPTLPPEELEQLKRNMAPLMKAYGMPLSLLGTGRRTEPATNSERIANQQGTISEEAERWADQVFGESTNDGTTSKTLTEQKQLELQREAERWADQVFGESTNDGTTPKTVIDKEDVPLIKDASYLVYHANLFAFALGTIGSISDGAAFKNIESFEEIFVFLNGDAEKIGLSKSQLTDYATLKFKNNFAGVKYENLVLFPKSKAEGYKTGKLYFGVSVVGDDYPIAYYVKCVAGSYGSGPIWSRSYLGYGSKENVPDTIKENISKMTEELAIDFFKARGEM